MGVAVTERREGQTDIKTVSAKWTNGRTDRNRVETLVQSKALV